ncbi:hypothetical protein RCL1_007075 [Eukaryota sp. TZLM3-RCL]
MSLCLRYKLFSEPEFSQHLSTNLVSRFFDRFNGNSECTCNSTISFSNHDLSDSFVELFCNHLDPHLSCAVSLQFINCSLTSSSLTHISDALSRPNTIQHLSIDCNSSVLNLTPISHLVSLPSCSLISLSLRCSSFEISSFSQFLLALRRNRSLQYLCLYGSNLTFCNDLSQMFRGPSTLKVVDFSNCKLNSISISSIISAFKPRVPDESDAVEVDMWSRVKKAKSGAAKKKNKDDPVDNPELLSLYSPMTSEGLLGGNQSVERLVLIGNDVSNEMKGELNSIIGNCCNLSRIDL